MIKPVQKFSYNIPWQGNPFLHEEIMWYATEDDQVLGVVIRDRVDNDYGWAFWRERAAAFSGAVRRRASLNRS
jgi:hypothetical protein